MRFLRATHLALRIVMDMFPTAPSMKTKAKKESRFPRAGNVNVHGTPLLQPANGSPRLAAAKLVRVFGFPLRHVLRTSDVRITATYNVFLQCGLKARYVRVGCCGWLVPLSVARAADSAVRPTLLTKFDAKKAPTCCA